MNWKLKDVKKITNEKWLNLYEAKYEVNGEEVNWTFASRKNIDELKCKHKTDLVDAVCVIPKFIKNNEEYLIMGKEFRLPINDYIYSFPAGLVEKGENLIDCAKREVKEEVGADVINLEQLTNLSYNSEGLTDENIIVYLADVTEISDADLQDNEDITREIVKVSDLKNFMKDKVFSAKANIFCSMYYKIYELSKNK